MARADIYDIRDLEDRLESDSLFADMGCSVINTAFRARPDVANRLDIGLAESSLVAINTKSVVVVCDIHCRRLYIVEIVVHVLYQLLQEMC